MMKKLETQHKLDPHALAEAALMADIAVLIAILRFYVPVAGMALHFFEPLPLILLVIRRGVRAGLMAALVGFLLTSMLTGPSAAFWLLRLCANGVVLGAGMRQNWHAFKTISVNTVLMWLLGIVFLAGAFWAFGIGPDDVRKDSTEFWTWFRDTAGWLLSYIGLNNWWHGIVVDIEPLVNWVITNWYIPALGTAAVYYACNSFGYYWVAEPLLMRLGITIPSLGIMVAPRRVRREGQT